MSIELLSSLALPDRYERLVERVGDDIARIIIAPPQDLLSKVEAIIDEVSYRDEGLLIPIYGKSGVGKTTFASSLSQWFPNKLSKTISFDGDVSYDALSLQIEAKLSDYPENFNGIFVLNFDHREGSLPTDRELSEIKRFLRKNPSGRPCIIFWPETNIERSRTLSSKYIAITGKTSINLPLVIEGPDRAAWPQVARDTLRIVNKIENLEHLGVDPRDFNSDEFATLGDFLRKVSQSFQRLLQQLRKELRKSLSITIVFASETKGSGVLSTFTSATRVGFLETEGLLNATPGSRIGKWWKSRRSLLTRAIVQLNAHAIGLGPRASISAIRNCSNAFDDVFREVQLTRSGPSRIVTDFDRSDFGKLLMRATLDRVEGRGTPAELSVAAFRQIAKKGFDRGRDKSLNSIMLGAVEEYLKRKNIKIVSAISEKNSNFAR